MNLRYEFDDMPVTRLCSAYEHVCNGWFTEHYEQETEDGVEYDYEVETTFADYWAYLKPREFREWPEEKQKWFKETVRKVWKSEIFDLELLEDSEEFKEFMKDRYYHDAREACEKEMNQDC